MNCDLKLKTKLSVFGKQVQTIAPANSRLFKCSRRPTGRERQVRDALASSWQFLHMYILSHHTAPHRTEKARILLISLALRLFLLLCPSFFLCLLHCVQYTYILCVVRASSSVDGHNRTQYSVLAEAIAFLRGPMLANNRLIDRNWEFWQR